MQSYVKRFDGQWPEIVKFACDFGIWDTLEKYAPDGDLLCFRNALRKVSEDENIGVCPRFGSLGLSNNTSPVERFREKLEDYVARTNARLLAKDKRIEELEKQISFYKNLNDAKIVARLTPLLEAIER